MTLPQNGFWEFDAFRLDVMRHRLLRGDTELPLAEKGVVLLLLLVHNRGRVVSHDELKKAGWSQAVVEDGSLREQIRLIRRALGDTAQGKRFVATVNTVGYRFVGKARFVPEADGDASLPAVRTGGEKVGQAPESFNVPSAPDGVKPDSERAARPRIVAHVTWLLLAAPVVGVASLVIIVGVPEPPLPRVAGVTRLTHDGLGKSGLMLLDESRLIVTSGIEQTIVRIDGKGSEQPNELREFYLLDVSLARVEALAIKPRDRGAEDGLWIVPLQGGLPRRLGVVRTSEYAAWSNDGRHIAYAFDSKLFIIDSDGVRQRELQAFSGIPGHPQWSPDDRFIRFTLHASSDRTDTLTLMDINVDGTGLRRATRDSGSASTNECCGSWIHSGREFMYEAGPYESRQIWLLREPKSVFGARPPERRRLAAESLALSRPVPSLDGKRIFALGRSEPQLVRYDLARREFVPYLPGLTALHAGFSSDANWIAYVRFPERTLWRARSSGRDASQLTLTPLQVHGQPSWSPDGKWIAFRGQMPGKPSKVYVVASVGGDPEPLDARDIEQGIPSWSPDGKLTFGDVPESFGQPRGGERIHIYDRARRELADVPGSDRLWSSRWSPDGRYLAALTIDGQGLMLFDFATKQWRSLGVNHVNNPTWSRDSKYVYCDPEGRETWLRRVRITDGAIEPILDLRNRPEWVGVTPDGSPLISRRLTDVYALELERR